MNVTENSAHPIAREEVMAFLDGEVSAERVAFLVTHVNECAECEETVTSFRKTSHSLSEWTVPAAPPNAEFEDRLSTAVLSASSKLRSPKIHLFPRRSWRLVAGSVALAAVLIIMIGLSTGRYEMSRKSVRTLASPGAVADSNGFFHGLGDHAEIVTVFSGPMIARTAEFTIVVNDFEAARGKMEAILTRHRGYAANLSTSNEPGSPRGLMASLRIPVAELEAALAELKALGRVRYESQKGEEVTQQHVDLVARLNNARETEKRMQAILEQRTGKISDVLAVEQEIARVRGEIEQMEAEQKTLEHRVDLAAVELKLAEEYKAQLDGSATSVSRRLRNALVTGYKDAVESLVSLCLFLAEYGPTLLLWVAILFWPARLVWRRWRQAAASI